MKVRKEEVRRLEVRRMKVRRGEESEGACAVCMVCEVSSNARVVM